MKNQKGLSDVVTTVIIIALSLVAIAVVWVVVQGLLAGNQATIMSGANCLNNDLVVTASVDSTAKTVTITAKRTRGNDAFDGVFVNAYNSTNFNVNGNITNIVGGTEKSATLSIANPNKVSAVFYKIENGKQVTCNTVVEKTI